MTTATTIQQAAQRLFELHDAEEALMAALSKANKAGITNVLNFRLTDVINKVTELSIQQQAHCELIKNN